MNKIVCVLGLIFLLFILFGSCEAGGENYYTKVGMHFQIFRPLTKNEGRKMLLEIAQVLLNELNLNSQLEPYLKPYPFNIDNIRLVLIAYYPDRTKVYHPDILTFSLSRGTIYYVTDIPELKYQHHTEESESFEEAEKIVHSQQADSING